MAQAAASPARPLPPRLVLFDGVCNFCDGAIRWLLARDPCARLGFASLQGETSARLRREHPEIPSDLETLVFVTSEGGVSRVFLRSDAVWRVCAELSGPWRRLAWLRFLPRGLRDLGYRAFASRRYRWFGQRDACRIPSESERARFWP
jgi:predicted DCC family thiol-disulfide oxidoreductase YuxK